MRMEPQGLGPAQGGQTTSAADAVPQIPGDRADVGAGGTVHLDAELPQGRIPIQQLQPVHGDGPWRQIHGFTAPCPGVGPFAIHMDGGDLRRTLFNRAPERLQAAVELGLTKGWPGLLLQQLSFQIVAAGAPAQLNHPGVGLLSGEVRQQSGRRP